jgi:hypothetical protein
VTSPAGSAESRWHRFLAGKTSWQRFVLQLGALAAAVATVSGVVLGGSKLVGAAIDLVTGTGEQSGSDGTQQVRNGTSAADDLVELLADRAESRASVTLDHQIQFGGIGNNQFTLQYHCEPGPCSTVTLIDYGVAATQVAAAADIRWFDGCWTVQMQGPGLDAAGLKLTLVRVGQTCP